MKNCLREIERGERERERERERGGAKKRWAESQLSHGIAPREREEATPHLRYSPLHYPAN